MKTEKDNSLYKRFLAEREEILKHKWYESEKVGLDIGFERALLDWVSRFRNDWIKGYLETENEYTD